MKAVFSTYAWVVCGLCWTVQAEANSSRYLLESQQFSMRASRATKTAVAAFEERCQRLGEEIERGLMSAKRDAGIDQETGYGTVMTETTTYGSGNRRRPSSTFFMDCLLRFKASRPGVSLVENKTERHFGESKESVMELCEQDSAEIARDLNVLFSEIDAGKRLFGKHHCRVRSLRYTISN